MASLDNPLRDDIAEDVKGVFNRFAYDNFNGVSREVTFTGTEQQVEHGLGFKPTFRHLTVRVHAAMADVGQVYLTRDPDERYVYVNTPRPGRVRLEISHPPLGDLK